jgi:hypothetical protein
MYLWANNCPRISPRAETPSLASVLAEEKVAKRGMVQMERLAVIFWYVKDCVQLFQHPIDSLLWYQLKHDQ